MNGRPEPKVLLYKLSVRKSASGREYLSGWTGSAKLLGFKDAEPGKYGEEVWSVYAVTPPPRGDQVAGDRAVGPRPEFLHTDGARAREGRQPVTVSFPTCTRPRAHEREGRHGD